MSALAPSPKLPATNNIAPDILWEDAPIGTTHYDPNEYTSDWVKYSDNRWYFWDNNKYRWAEEFTTNECALSRYIAK